MSKDGGNWVTIKGVHVLIGGNGTVSKGPSKFIGKTIDEIREGGSTTDKSTDKKSSSSSGKDGKDLLPDYDYMSEDEALEKLSEQGLNTVEDVIKAQGFNGLPTVMNSQEFDEYVSNGGGIELKRGISANDKETADKYTNELKYGDFYVAGGEAYFGQGMYAFGGENIDQANNYARGSGGTVISMALPKDAKILEVNGKEGLTSKEVIKTFYKEVDAYDHGQPIKELAYNKDNRLDKYLHFINYPTTIIEDTLKKAGYKLAPEPDMSLLSKDLGKYLEMEAKYKASVKLAGLDYLRKNLPKEDVKLLMDYDKGSKPNNIITASRGYDAIKLSSEYVNENSSNGPCEIWIVLNRSKLVIKEE